MTQNVSFQKLVSVKKNTTVLTLVLLIMFIVMMLKETIIVIDLPTYKIVMLIASILYTIIGIIKGADAIYFYKKIDVDDKKAMPLVKRIALLSFSIIIMAIICIANYSAM